jgi:short-subunit dehydrogenase
MKNVLIIGANSDIGFACAGHFQKQNCSVTLAAHKPEQLPSSSFEVIQFDVTQDSPEALGTDFDIVLYAAGKMFENQETIDSDKKNAVQEVNFNAPVRILSHCAGIFEKRGNGTIAGITSVAAVRGKASTVIYGAAKSGFDSFLSGLRSHIHPTVQVINFRLGYVDTKMTDGLDLPKLLTASKESAATKIVKHCLSGKRNIVYIKAIWRPIAYTLKNIPEFIFKRLKL